jgi:hypothetical protein
MRQRSTQPAPSSHTLPTGSTRSYITQHTSSLPVNAHSSTIHAASLCTRAHSTHVVFIQASIRLGLRALSIASCRCKPAVCQHLGSLTCGVWGGTRVVLPFAVHCPPLKGNREPPERVSRAWSPGALGISVFHSCGGCESGAPACGAHEAKVCRTVYLGSFSRMNTWRQHARPAPSGVQHLIHLTRS